MAEVDVGEVTGRMKALAGDYLLQKTLRDQAEEQMIRIKAQMVEESHGAPELPPIQFGDLTVNYSVRASSRKPNVVALQRAGVAKEEFCTLTPTMKAFQKMVEKRGWGEDYAAKFVVSTGDMIPSVTIRRIETAEETSDDDN